MISNIPSDVSAEIKEWASLVVDVEVHREEGCTTFVQGSDGRFRCEECGALFFEENEDGKDEL